MPWNWNDFPLTFFDYFKTYEPTYAPPPPSFWSRFYIPETFAVTSASLNWVINCTEVYYVILAAFVGALTACAYNSVQMTWGQRGPTFALKKRKATRRPISLPNIDPDLIREGDRDLASPQPSPSQRDILQHLANHRELGMTGDMTVPQKKVSDCPPTKGHDLDLPTPDIPEHPIPRISSSSASVQTRSSTPKISSVSVEAQTQAEQIQIPDFFSDQFNPVLPVTFEEEIVVSSKKSDMDTVKNEVILHQFPRGKFHPCLSPQGLKVESCLRMCGIPYEISFDCDASGPWISYGDDTFIGAHDCVKFLQKTFPEKVKGHLPKMLKQVPVWYMYILLELHLPWSVSLWRGITGEASEMAASTKHVGKMTTVEILGLINNDLTALSSSLANKEFLIGTSVTDLDCSAFAILAQLLWPPGSDHPFEKLMQSYPTLIKYCHRIQSLIWKDWDNTEQEVKDQGQGQSQGEIYEPQNQGKSRSRVKREKEEPRPKSRPGPARAKAPGNSQSAPNSASYFIQSPASRGRLFQSSSYQAAPGQSQNQGQGQLNNRMPKVSRRSHPNPYNPRQEVGIFTMQQQDRPLDFGL